jgi:hypothetical protein
MGGEKMKKYFVRVILEMEDEVEAETPEEAFEIVSDNAIGGGDWQWDFEEVESEE